MADDDGGQRGETMRRDLRGIRRSLSFLALATAIAGLYLARDFFLPVTLAVILTLVLRPIARALRAIGLPQALGAAVIVLGLVGSVGTGLYFISEPAGKWIEQAPQIGRSLQYKFRDLFQSASAIGDVGDQVKDIATGGKDAEVQEVVVREAGLIARAASGGASFLVSLLLFTALLYFLLAAGDMFLEKLVHALPRFRDKVRAIQVAREIEREISRYLFTVTAVNVGLGVCIAGAMALAGLPNPVLWGGAAALLNFIPYIGAVIGATVVFAISVVTFPTPFDILLPPLLYLTLTTIEGQLVTPTVLGRRLDMNPVAIFLGVAFWGWLWGVAGAVMAAPILLVAKISADHVERWAPLSGFLSVRGYGARAARRPGGTIDPQDHS